MSDLALCVICADGEPQPIICRPAGARRLDDTHDRDNAAPDTRRTAVVTHDDDDTSRWLWLAVAAGMALWLAVAAGILLAVWLASAVIA